MLESKFDRTKASEICKQMVENDVKSLFFDFSDEKIKTFKDGSTILKDVSNKKYQGIKRIIKEVIDDGVISYNYAYNFAETFIKKYPAVRRLVRKRFKFVFIDEMQDMENTSMIYWRASLNVPMLYIKGWEIRIRQFYSGNISLENIWQDRPSVLPLKGSHRLSPRVAKIVNNFAINGSSIIKGENLNNISPCMIVFSESCIQDVIPKFVELVKEKVPEETLLKSTYPIKVVGWKKNTNERGDLGIRSYCNNFKVSALAKKTFYRNLRSYFKDSYVKTRSLSVVRDDLLDSLVMSLRKEEIVPKNGGYFNNYSLCRYLRDYHKDFYKEFQLKIFCWSFDIYRGKIEESLADIRCFIPKLMKIFDKEVVKSKEFINDNIIEGQADFPKVNHWLKTMSIIAKDWSKGGNMYCSFG